MLLFVLVPTWKDMVHNLCLRVYQLYAFVVKRWGANSRTPNSFKRGKSININKTAVPVTCVTFAVTGDRHQRATHSPRISLKSASNCASALEVLCFLPLGVAVGQMHQAFSETLARIRPISWTGVKDNQSGIHFQCTNFGFFFITHLGGLLPSCWLCSHILIK